MEQITKAIITAIVVIGIIIILWVIFNKTTKERKKEIQQYDARILLANGGGN